MTHCCKIPVTQNQKRVWILMAWRVQFICFDMFKFTARRKGFNQLPLPVLSIGHWPQPTSSPLFLAAYVLYRRAEPEELWYVQDVFKAPPRLPRRPVLGRSHHLPAHGRLQRSAPWAEIHHQLCGLLREYAKAFVQGGAVPRLPWLLGIGSEDASHQGTSSHHCGDVGNVGGGGHYPPLHQIQGARKHKRTENLFMNSGFT